MGAIYLACLENNLSDFLYGKNLLDIADAIDFDDDYYSLVYTMASQVKGKNTFCIMEQSLYHSTLNYGAHIRNINNLLKKE